MLSNIEQNPSRKSRGLKIIDDMVFTIPVNKKIIKNIITEDLNKLIWGHRYRRKIENETNIRELKYMLSKEDKFPDNYVFKRQDKLDFFDNMFKSVFDTANTVDKSLMFKVIREQLEHSRTNSLEFNYTKQLENIQNAITYLNGLEQEGITILDNNMLFKLSSMYSQVREEHVFSPLVLQGKEVKVRSAINWFKSEKETILNQRDVKLETLPKDYSDYLISQVIRNSINYYILANSYAGYFANLFEHYYIIIDFYMPDSEDFANIKEARFGEQALFAFRYLEKVLIPLVKKVKDNNGNYQQELFVKTLNDTPENILTYLEKCLYNIYKYITIERNPTEEYDQTKENYLKAYKFFWEVLTIYMNNEKEFISGGDEFKYNSLEEIMKDFFSNVRLYKDSSSIQANASSISIDYLTDHYIDKNQKFIPMITDLKRSSRRMDIGKLTLPLIHNDLIHFSEMRNIIPELHKYVLNNRYSPEYHVTNMSYLEYRHVSNEAFDAISKLIKKRDAIQEKKPLNYQQRVNETNSIIENILHGKKMLDKHLDAFLEMVAEFEKDGSHRRWRGLLGESKSYSEQLLRRLEQADDSKKLIRNQLDWGATVLEFNKNYIPAIKYVHNEIDLKSGFFWEKLPFGFSEKERNTMGHCGNAGRNDDDFIYSLRRKYKDGKYSVHVTLTVQKDLGVTIECKGRGNATPIEEYWPYLVELFIRDEFIVCAESGLGHNPRVDFNINMSQDALDNKEKIEELKPYLFSKKKIVFEKFSDVNYLENKKKFTANEVLFLYSKSKDNNWEFIRFFLDKHPDTSSILANYEYNPNVKSGEVYKKYKSIIEKTLIDHLVSKDLINVVYDENFGELYELECTLIDIGLEDYKGRDMFDDIASTKGNTIDLSEQIEFDFGEFDFTDEKHRQIAIEFIKEEFSNGFIFLKFIKSTNKDHVQTTQLIEFDYYEFIEEMTLREKNSTWLASHIVGYKHIDGTFSRTNIHSIKETFKHKRVIDKLKKYENANEIISLILSQADENEIDPEVSDAVEYVRSAFGIAVSQLNESDMDDQIYSRFSEEIAQYVEYNPDDKKFYFIWDNFFKQIDESECDDDDKNIGSYTNFYDIVSSLYKQKYPANRLPMNKVKDIYSYERLDFHNFANKQTSGNPNAVRLNSALQLFVKFSNKYIDWNSVSSFEACEYDFLVTDEDKVSDFIEMFVDSLEVVEFSKEYLENLKSLIK